MSRSRRKRGRPYQPLPERRSSPWPMRLVVAFIGLMLILGSLVIFVGQ